MPQRIVGSLRQPTAPGERLRGRGSQFRSRKFHAAPRHHCLVGSMGRVATAADNAAMESWFSLLQENALDRQRTRSTRDELRFAIVWWTVHTYNTRRQRALGRMTPVDYES